MLLSHQMIPLQNQGEWLSFGERLSFSHSHTEGRAPVLTQSLSPIEQNMIIHCSGSLTRCYSSEVERMALEHEENNPCKYIFYKGPPSNSTLRSGALCGNPIVDSKINIFIFFSLLYKFTTPRTEQGQLE